ncbi:isopenicillin N synthase family dioxygenase [Haloglycomyces albus]|uniref:isopenicillin N synthase family dioxygenase n=1 Tax=Haloglycomyces albus TaxID=526067 RepID=UPI00046D5CA1|nr:2-oxoglutarate and iron-dependent oxygenase domain-containing protein [Haloglycomyces albus]
MLAEISLKTPVDREAVLDALATGFFYVEHGLPESLLDEAYAMLRTFFELPEEEKTAVRTSGSNGQSGYTPLLVETPEVSRVADWKELFHWGPAIPSHHPLRTAYPDRYPDPVFAESLVPGMGRTLLELHRRMKEFQLSVVAVLGEALGVGSEYFAEMLDEGPTVNRAAWYPAMDDAPPGTHLWAAEHQDFDLITALPRATAEGLEVKGPDGGWIRASAGPAYAVVNVGMVLERLTGGLAKAAVHRVVAEAEQEGPRLSIVQFCHPTPWTVVNSSDIEVEGHQPVRYPALTADALFRRTMFRINRIDGNDTDA